MYLGSLPVVSTHWTGSLKCFWLGLDEALLTHEHYRSALRDFNGDSPFTQPPFAAGVVWFSVEESVMSREIERCCDAKWLLPGSVRGTETGVGERQSSCAVNLLLEMWGVPTLFKNP